MPFKESMTTQVKPLQGESDFVNWQRRIRRQLQAFDLWEYVEEDKPTPVPGEDEDQEDFSQRLKEHKKERNQAMHLLENAIHDDVFDTLRSHGYDLLNSDPKVLMDTLNTVLTKATTGSIQSMGQELFSLDADKFDSLRHYLNRATYLRERVNNAGMGITDKAMQTILFGGVQKSYPQLYFNLTYGGHAPDYVTVLQTLQALANDETQLSLAQVTGGTTDDDKHCKKCGKKHPKDWPHHEACKRCHKGGDDACWLLHPELREQWQQARSGGSTPVTPTPVGNPAGLHFHSGIHG